MKYTREQMLAIGMTEEQINIMLNQNQDDEAKEGVEKIVHTTVLPTEKVEYTEDDITSLSDIVKFSSGTIVRLPDFADGAPFIAKLKRPSMLVMVKTGKIPNSLITQATQLFKSGAGSLGKDNSIEDLYEIMEIICDAAMVKPTYKEIKDSGVTLSDNQIMAIFSYTQNGVKALESFR